VHEFALLPLLNFPLGQSVQSWSAVVEPAVDTNFPPVQVVHGVHEAAFDVVLNEPAAHAVHVRSEVGVPWRLT
jgi:hypothetical protein